VSALSLLNFSGSAALIGWLVAGALGGVGMEMFCATVTAAAEATSAKSVWTLENWFRS